ncbi:Com family DNA-binding transcriptional regulator [Pannonibacter sp. SL95]|uniref:Com family DNA-binding transcriptional regulator n=1 Tax=Pannonibacter sp. SL95 TaxID=2995153 RepID=UPI003FA35C63
MKDIRCGCCRALLFRMAAAPSAPAIEIKCRRCGTINHLRPPEPAPERQERAEHEAQHVVRGSL